MTRIQVFAAVVVLTLVVLAVLAVNDKQKAALKSKSQSDKTEKPGRQPPFEYSTLKDVFWLAIGVIGLAACVLLLPPNRLQYLMWIGGAILLLFLCVLLGPALLKVAAFVLLSYVRRQKVTFVIRSNDAMMHIDCPKCGAKCKLYDIEMGGHAFTCDECGESGKWT